MLQKFPRMSWSLILMMVMGFLLIIILLQFQSYSTLLSHPLEQSSSHSPSRAFITDNNKNHAPLRNAQHNHESRQHRPSNFPVFRWSDFPSPATPHGTFVFRDSSACADRANSPCLVHFPQPNDACLSDHACLQTRKGFKPPQMGFGEDSEAPSIPNQDRSLLLQPLTIFANAASSSAKDGAETKSDTANNNLHPNDFLLLLADGHGSEGHISAAAVQRDLPGRILKLLEEQQQQNPPSKSSMTALLQRAFLECDEQVVQKVAVSSGTTTIVILQYQSVLYMASVGDSIATVWGYQNNDERAPTLLAEAIKHKPHLPAERQRIEQHQGQVLMPQTPGDSSRVVIPVNSDGLMGEMALAMSRSMGDTDGKVPGWLLAEPAVQVLDSTTTHNFDQLLIMVCSDGVADMQPIAAMAAQLGKSLQTPLESNLQATMHSIMTQSANEWFRRTFDSYRDDMTLVVHSVPLPNKNSKDQKRMIPSIFQKRLRGF